MNDEDLIAEFVEVRRAEEGVGLWVREIGWQGPYTPVSSWTLAKTLPATASEDRIETEVRRLLTRKRYFRVCEECGERNPIGWMLDTKICQSCAERNHGVVF